MGESETPVPTTVLDLQKRNSVEICNGDQEILAAMIAESSSRFSSKRPSLSDEFELEVLRQSSKINSKLSYKTVNLKQNGVQKNSQKRNGVLKNSQKWNGVLKNS